MDVYRLSCFFFAFVSFFGKSNCGCMPTSYLQNMNVGATVVQQWDSLENRNADPLEISAVFSGVYGKQLSTPQCRKFEGGYHNETVELLDLKQLNYFELMASNNNDWNATIKCTNQKNDYDKATFYYLGRFGLRMYFSYIHSLNKPYIFIRNIQNRWDVVAIGAYYPCSLDNIEPNAVAEPLLNGKTVLSTEKDFTFLPTWAVVFMSHHFQYTSGWTNVFTQEALMTLSNTKKMVALLKGNTSSVFVHDNEILMPTNHGPIQVGGAWKMFDDYFESTITISKYSWWKFMNRYFPENIKYSEVTAPANKMKDLLTKHVQSMKIIFLAIQGAYKPGSYKQYLRGATDENLNSPSKYHELQGLRVSGTFVNTDALPTLFRNKKFLITSAGKEFYDIHVWFDMNACESVFPQGFQNLQNLIELMSTPQKKKYEGLLKCKEDRSFRLHYFKFNLLRDASQLGKYRITVAWVRNQNNVNEIHEMTSVMNLNQFADILTGREIREESIFN